MNVLYAVSAQCNPLYEGKFGLHGRYQTYGHDNVRSSVFMRVCGLSSAPQNI